MATQSIGIPSARGMKGAFTDFAVGAGGGLVYGLGQALMGNGLLGALAAPVLAGSVVKGTRGSMLATMAGFMLLANSFTGSAQAAPAAADSGVI